MDIKKIINTMLGVRLIERAELLEKKSDEFEVTNRIQLLNEGIAVLCKDRNAYFQGITTEEEMQQRCYLYQEELWLRKEFGYSECDENGDYFNYVSDYSIPDLKATSTDEIMYDDILRDVVAGLKCYVSVKSEGQPDEERKRQLSIAREEIFAEEGRKCQGNMDAGERLLMVEGEILRIKGKHVNERAV